MYRICEIYNRDFLPTDHSQSYKYNVKRAASCLVVDTGSAIEIRYVFEFVRIFQRALNLILFSKDQDSFW